MDANAQHAMMARQAAVMVSLWSIGLEGLEEKRQFLMALGLMLRGIDRAHSR